MTALNITAVVESEADDIRSLMNQLDTGDFSYVDIAVVEAWHQALEQWPLLAEWDQWSKAKHL